MAVEREQGDDEGELDEDEGDEESLQGGVTSAASPRVACCRA